MPYEWSNTDAERRLSAWPNRSLPRRGFVTFFGCTAILVALPLLAVLGSPVLWGVLPFMVIVMWGLWAAIHRSYADGKLLEELTFRDDQVKLTRYNPRGPKQEWAAHSQWVKVMLHEEDGPVENYVTLRGGGREVEIGAFLSADERLELYHDLNRSIRP
jgi:uncharacterized membrane protein